MEARQVVLVVKKSILDKKLIQTICALELKDGQYTGKEFYMHVQQPFLMNYDTETFDDKISTKRVINIDEAKPVDEVIPALIEFLNHSEVITHTPDAYTLLGRNLGAKAKFADYFRGQLTNCTFTDVRKRFKIRKKDIAISARHAKIDLDNRGEPGTFYQSSGEQSAKGEARLIAQIYRAGMKKRVCADSWNGVNNHYKAAIGLTMFSERTGIPMDAEVEFDDRRCATLEKKKKTR